MPADAITPARLMWRNRSVRFLLGSVFCSTTAVLAQATALGKLVYDITGSQFDLGLLGLAEFLPGALLVLVTGTVADRYDRRLVLALSCFAQALLAVGLVVVAGSGPATVTPIFGLVFLFGVARSFAAPSGRSLPSDIVTPDMLPRLVATYSASWQASTVVGPVLAGFLYAVDPGYPFVAVAILTAIAGLAALAIRPLPRIASGGGGLGGAGPVGGGGGGGGVGGRGGGVGSGEAKDRGIHAASIVGAIATGGVTGAEAADGDLGVEGRAGMRQALDGLRFVRRSPILLGAISLDLFAVLFGGAVALLPAIATDRLGVGSVGFGWLRAAGGLGAGVVAVSLAIRPITRHVGRILLAVVALFGVGTIALGFTRNYAVAFAAVAGLSAADAVSVFIRSTLSPLVTPPSMRGRVLAVEHVFIGASNELGAFESGVAGQVLGTAGAVISGGIATLVVAVGWWFWFPSLRNVDRFPGGPDPD